MSSNSYSDIMIIKCNCLHLTIQAGRFMWLLAASLWRVSVPFSRLKLRFPLRPIKFRTSFSRAKRSFVFHELICAVLAPFAAPWLQHCFKIIAQTIWINRFIRRFFEPYFHDLWLIWIEFNQLRSRLIF